MVFFSLRDKILTTEVRDFSAKFTLSTDAQRRLWLIFARLFRQNFLTLVDYIIFKSVYGSTELDADECDLNAVGNAKLELEKE